MEEKTSIKGLFLVIQKRLPIILLLTVTLGIISGVISYFVLAPVYQASTQVLINQKDANNSSLNGMQIKTNTDLINTYSAILKSRTILEEVKNELNLSQSVDTLSQQITVNSQENSQVFSVIVEDKNAIEAAKIANTVSETFRKEIPNIMNIDNVTVLSKANLKDKMAPIEPHPITNVAVTLVIGFMTSIALAFLLEYMDNTIKNEADVEKLLGLPVLGCIEKIFEDNKPKMNKNSISKQIGSGKFES
ncbi:MULTISPECIES: YveK family protein [Priestia]|uniref:YveK family protein n=1 Tax=Priestia sp. FSL P4-0332 TaxID=2921634 RepID=UPI0030F749E6